jgi:hypothetical protein
MFLKYMRRGSTRSILATLFTAAVMVTQSDIRAQEPLSIEAKTQGMERIDGFFPLYWDEAKGQLWMEIARFDTEVLHLSGLASGLGSNDIGLDRGQSSGSRIVVFERVGPKVLMVQPNYRFRASSDSPAEVKAVRDGFARSVLWGFEVAAQTGNRVLVDLNDFLLRDASGIAGRLQPGSYRLEASRSTIYMPMTMGFPENTQMEVELTFARQAGAGGGRGRRGGGGFEGVGSVAASAEAASLRVHHSLVQLPDDDYEPRVFDPRSGFGSMSYEDYSAPLGSSMTKRFIRRHRLKKVDPSAPVSPPVEPIVYYLDPGVPEPVRTALLDGARWWNQAFEAAGYQNGFRVELLPQGASSHDIRYNVINWVHRSTRGWSSGGSVTDPRTGEIIKGVVTLGSLRVRQDYMIAEGLLAPYVRGDETPPELAEWALDRIRQLSAHEVGHTLGLGHNYYDSQAGRISVLDYPHPLVRLEPDGSFDISEVYDLGIGAWDSVAINYGYQDFPPGTDEQQALTAILDEAWDQDIIFMTNQDMSANPKVDQWSNGADPAVELNRMMDVRRTALDRFGQNAIRGGMPLATMEEVLVPLYMHHRYQIDATASALGGQHYIYALRGDGRQPFQRVVASDQRAALQALLATLHPSQLALPDSVVQGIPPRPPGFGSSRETFPRYTGSTFDVISPAVVVADHVVSNLLNAQRAARLVQQKALAPQLPGLQEVLDALVAATSSVASANPYEAEIKRAVERVVMERMAGLAQNASMPQVRAIATAQLEDLSSTYGNSDVGGVDGAHYSLLARDIERFLNRPAEAFAQPATPSAPPGAPIGQAPMEWVRRYMPQWDCGWFR